jgi:hypothetical protein
MDPAFEKSLKEHAAETPPAGETPKGQAKGKK